MSELAQLKSELKAWERNFREEHGGRDPTKEESKQDATIAAKYKRYRALVRESKKPASSDSNANLMISAVPAGSSHNPSASPSIASIKRSLPESPTKSSANNPFSPVKRKSASNSTKGIRNSVRPSSMRAMTPSSGEEDSPTVRRIDGLSRNTRKNNRSDEDNPFLVDSPTQLSQPASEGLFSSSYSSLRGQSSSVKVPPIGPIQSSKRSRISEPTLSSNRRLSTTSNSSFPDTTHSVGTTVSFSSPSISSKYDFAPSPSKLRSLVDQTSSSLTPRTKARKRMRGEDIPVTPGEEIKRKKKRSSLFVLSAAAEVDGAGKSGVSRDLWDVRGEGVRKVQPQSGDISAGEDGILRSEPGDQEDNHVDENDEVFPESPVKLATVGAVKRSSVFRDNGEEIEERGREVFRPLFGESSPHQTSGRSIPTKIKRSLPPTPIANGSPSTRHVDFVLPSRKQKPNDSSIVGSSLRPRRKSLITNHITNTYERSPLSEDVDMDPLRDDEDLDQDPSLRPSLTPRPVKLRAPSPPDTTLDPPSHGMGNKARSKIPRATGERGREKPMKSVGDTGAALVPREASGTKLGADVRVTNTPDDEDYGDSLVLSPVNLPWNYVGIVEVPLPRAAQSRGEMPEERNATAENTQQSLLMPGGNDDAGNSGDKRMDMLDDPELIVHLGPRPNEILPLSVEEEDIGEGEGTSDSGSLMIGGRVEAVLNDELWRILDLSNGAAGTDYHSEDELGTLRDVLSGEGGRHLCRRRLVGDIWLAGEGAYGADAHDLQEDWESEPDIFAEL